MYKITSSTFDGVDTDSLFINLGSFLDKHIGDKWRSLDEEKIIDYIRKISSVIEDNVDSRSYREIQRKCYNSNVTDFRITFKQEIVAKSTLFVKKKKYSFWCVDEEGAPVDKLKTTGLEIIRSETPEAVRPRLKNIMNLILKDTSDDELINIIERYKKELKEVYPEEISVNTSVNNINKYISPTGPRKGTPWHVKGVYNYREMLKHLDIVDKYEDIHNKSKAKIIYVKKNAFGFESVSFLRWPKEFNEIVQIDYDKMIKKYFTAKIEILLDPMNKKDLLNSVNKSNLNLFF